MSAELFTGKRILLVCKETYSYPLYFLAKKWLKNNQVAAFFFNPCETKYAKCILNEITYFAYKELDGMRLYTSNSIADEFTEMLYGERVCDEEYLNKIEDDYTHFQNVNNQIMATQFMTRHYHYRNYMHVCTYSQQLNWLILNYKNVIRIIDDFKPDVVLDTDNAELARTVLREVCYKNDIPYITIDHPRYEMYKLYTYNLGIRYSGMFREAYGTKINCSDNELNEAYTYIEEFNNRANIMHSMYKNDVTAQYKPKPLLESIKNVLRMVKYFVGQDRAGDNKRIKDANPLLYPNSWEYIKFYYSYEITKQRLMRKNKYFRVPEEVKYVYMPLHLIPESTTFSISPMYVNELDIISAVSKSLPAGWWLYVKEHQAMVGERGVDFYEKANRLPNVRMVQLNYFQDPKPWITNSQGVVTISGTSAYEAALLGKHSIVFSDTPFSLIDGIERVHSFEDLPAALSRFKEPMDNKKSCAAFIETVKQMGYSINLKQLLSDGEQILRGRKTIDESYQENLDNLEMLFYDGYIGFKPERKA